MPPVPDVSRRKLLASVAGGAGLAGLGYLGARGAAKRGTVVTRYVSGERLDGDTLTGQTQIFEAELDPDGPAERRVHPDYRERFPDDTPVTVSSSLHRHLADDFDRIAYHVGQNCPTAECSTPRLRRPGFNRATLGREIRLLYHSGSWATIVP